MNDFANPGYDIGKTAEHKPFRYFYLLAVLFAVCAAIGMKLSEDTGMLSELEFYGRYDGLSEIRKLGDFLPYFKAVLSRSEPFLISSAALFILSFSSLLLPAGILFAVFRGFTAGAAFCLVQTPSALAQLILYIISAIFGCAMSSALISLRSNASGAAESFFKRASVLFRTTGGYILCEFILSLII